MNFKEETLPLFGTQSGRMAITRVADGSNERETSSLELSDPLTDSLDTCLQLVSGGNERNQKNEYNTLGKVEKSPEELVYVLVMKEHAMH